MDRWIYYHKLRERLSPDSRRSHYHQGRFQLRQFIGLIRILTGLALFFHHKAQKIFISLTEHTPGVMLIIGASVTCAALMLLAQKKLLTLLNSWQILFLLTATPGNVLALDLTGMILFAFCSANTALAYIFFDLFLEHFPLPRMPKNRTLAFSTHHLDRQ